MVELVSGSLTFLILVGALLILLRGMRPSSGAARTWSDFRSYSDDGPPWSMAVIAAFALGELARHGPELPAVAAVCLGVWCGLFRKSNRLVALLPGMIGAAAAIMGSIAFVASASDGVAATIRAAILILLGLLFAMFGIARVHPLAGLTWFAALDIIVFLVGPLGVTWFDIGGMGGFALPIIAIVLAVALAFMPSAFLPLAAAGVVIVQLAGTGTGYLPGDLTATITIVMVTMVTFALTAIVRGRLLGR